MITYLFHNSEYSFVYFSTIAKFTIMLATILTLCKINQQFLIILIICLNHPKYDNNLG